MDYEAELEYMRKKYALSPIKGSLPRPHWLNDNDELNTIFMNQRQLFSHGIVCYGCIVQANNLLFSLSSLDDYPASLILSQDDIMVKHIDALDNMSHEIYRYKNNFQQAPYEKYSEIVHAVRDEYDRSSFSFKASEYDAQIDFITTIVFRSHLPLPILKGRIVPMLASPDSKTAIILPKCYWSLKMRLHYIFKGLY